MQRNDEGREEDLIDLGAASTVTQGSGGSLFMDGNQYRNTPFGGITD